MSTKRISKSHTALYFIALVIIVIAFLLLGGGTWMSGMMHRNGLAGISYWNWPQILISLGIGFLLGLLVSRRNR